MWFRHRLLAGLMGSGITSWSLQLGLQALDGTWEMYFWRDIGL